MNSAQKHLLAASAHMALADHRAEDADRLMHEADEQLVVAAAKLAEATSDSDEYQRALYHYTQLVRHRMANPLQVISGMAQTLANMPDLPESDRAPMLDAILGAARVLERICLEPKIMHASEHELEPVPALKAHHPPTA
jgi:signal transduction histidine kinase